MSPPEEESAGLAAATTPETVLPLTGAGAGPRRTKLSWAQLVRLESIFAQTWYPSWNTEGALGRPWNLLLHAANSPLPHSREHQQINVWFCNRRTKAKREKETMPDSFIPSHAQAALKSKRARPTEASLDTLGSTTMTREPTPEPAPSSRASSTTPDPRPIALPSTRQRFIGRQYSGQTLFVAVGRTARLRDIHGLSGPICQPTSVPGPFA
ncbi:Homeobox domain-containing protein [Rhizoctonia solani AG-1 IA]|uniref:Homeobox domain-containing protein n=1 Tax=Thanatephorus cucumeris (strain AG1-IA) TaxID=983506 RepID=L8XAD4_THACA|nr:Homeobox domain-containing protein [Rhizoctonia solani AG-1 IA]